MTPKEIKEIQKTGIDWFGWPLKIDGVLGPRSNWWLGITSLCPERQQVIRIALGYHAAGMREDENGRNGGEFVDMLFKDGKTGLKNQPWCAVLASHVYKKADVPFPKYFTSAWQFIDWAKREGKVVASPLPGDVVAYLHPMKEGDTQRKGHVEICLAFDETHTYDVAGNVANAVRAGKRPVTPEMVYIRTLDSQHGPLSVPFNMPRIDNIGDR